ncbi:MAG: TetR family transcriptional regulator [Acidothermaceae bacterium]
MNKTAGRRGRRAGAPDTRQQVLEVARRRFLAAGYQGVTLRSVAAEAGVDVALISYFFGSKKGLFGAAMALTANPAERFAVALDGDLAGLPERVLRILLDTWDTPATGLPLKAMLRNAIEDEAVGLLVRQALERELLDKLVERLGGVDARRRASAFTVQVAGVVFARFVLRLEPVASMPADELVRTLSPSLRAALMPVRART